MSFQKALDTCFFKSEKKLKTYCQVHWLHRRKQWWNDDVLPRNKPIRSDKNRVCRCVYPTPRRMSSVISLRTAWTRGHSTLMDIRRTPRVLIFISWETPPDRHTDGHGERDK